MKRCSRCKIEKDFSLFSPNKATKSGLSSQCKPCSCLTVRKSAKRNYDKILERNRLYRERNPEKVKEWKRKDRQNNKPRIVADNARRREKLKSKKDKRIDELYALRDFMKAMSLGDDFHVDHIVPLSAGGKHEFDNLQILPARCNLMKGKK